MPTHLVTGAGSGIGAALARRLLARGDELVLVARNHSRAEQLESEFPGARPVVADLADVTAVDRAFAAIDLPPLDSLVHAAGVVDVATVAELPPDSWREQVEVNLVAPAVLTRALLPSLREARGHVVFVNSTSGLSVAPGWSAYGASKAGLRALADALRAEESGNGVRVTSVYPSRTATPMQERVHAQEGREYDPGDWIQPDSVVSTIVHALDLPRDAHLSDVTIRS